MKPPHENLKFWTMDYEHQITLLLEERQESLCDYLESSMKGML